MEPAVEVVGRLDRVLASDVFREGIVVSVPSVDRVRVSRDGEAVGAELIFDDALKGAGSAELAHGPFELSVRVVTVVLALVPVANRKSNRLGIAKRSNFPRSRDAVFVGDGGERHGADEGGDADDG